MNRLALLVLPLHTLAQDPHHHSDGFCCWYAPGPFVSDWCANCKNRDPRALKEWCLDGVWCDGHEPHPPHPTPSPPSPTTTPAPTPTPPPPPAPSGQTQLTKFLNDQIAWSGDANQVYTVGKGIMVRSPLDGFEEDEDKNVVPATFWVNDLMAPSQLYPGVGGGGGNPWCPTDYAAWNCDTDPDTQEWGPWAYAQLAAVLGSSMNKLFDDFDNIQSEDWGWGVFYASDSNSVDKRCRYLDSFNGFDCPGGWIPMNGDFSSDNVKFGAGSYDQGNPYAGGGGGGAGCHFDNGNIDQTNAYDSSGQNLVQDYDCQCNYAFNEDWGAWVDQWLGGVGPTASWANDIAACWTNNLRDMIKIQNQLWWKRWDWSDRSVPYVDYDSSTAWKNRPYWGWNEIPVSREVVTNMDNWDAIMIKLPADACLSENGRNDQLSCYDIRFHASIEYAIDSHVDAGYLGVGKSSSPSSSVVLAREYMDDSGNYFREFFCEAWVSPNGKYEIVFEPDDETEDGSGGACYLEHPSVQV